jgi:hypothetical protein
MTAAVSWIAPHLSVHFRSLAAACTPEVAGLAWEELAGILGSRRSSCGLSALLCTGCGRAGFDTFRRSGLNGVIRRGCERPTAMCAVPLAVAHSGDGGMTTRVDHCAESVR